MRRYAVPLGLALFFVLVALFPPSSYSQPERCRMKMEESLNLTPEQKTKVDEFRKARRQEMQSSMDKMRKVRDEFRELINDRQADAKKIEALIDDMGRMRSETLKSRLKDSREMRKIFTPEQLEKLDKFKARMADRSLARSRLFWSRGGGRSGWRAHAFWGRRPLSPRLRERWWLR